MKQFLNDIFRGYTNSHFDDDSSLQARISMGNVDFANHFSLITIEAENLVFSTFLSPF